MGTVDSALVGQAWGETDTAGWAPQRGGACSDMLLRGFFTIHVFPTESDLVLRDPRETGAVLSCI